MRFVLALLSVMAATAAAAAAEHVEIAQGEFRLGATLYRPSGNGPVPSIIALHGCGGLIDRAGRLRPEYHEWGERLLKAGFAVLFPDSFTARGLGPQCTVQNRRVRPYRERLHDANAARQWLQRQSWAQPERVSLLGWSHGAITTLWTVRPRAAPKDGRPDFRSAVAFYPGCRRLGDTAWSARIPTLLLLGGADDWSPARDCEQMVAGAKGRSAKAEVVTYRDAYQYFDRGNLPLQERHGLAFTPDGSGRAHVGTNGAARDDAIRRVPEWLAR